MKTGVSRPFLLIGLPAALGFVALIWGGMELKNFLFTSPRFAVRHVEVITKGQANTAMILKRAAIGPNTNIFSLNLEEVRGRVEKEPWVYSAAVVRVLPDKIQIHYTPQVPKAILGADSMYYLNGEGTPFYRIQKGDSLRFPLVQVEGQSKDPEIYRQRVAFSLQILDKLRESKLFAEKDLGDMRVRMEAMDGAAPYVLNLRFPPTPLQGKGGYSNRLYSVSFGDAPVESQVKYWESVARYLVQQGKNPKLIRLELGKKVVVKLER